MVKIKIDGKEFELDEKKNLIDASKEVGVDIPYFCYHPSLSIVGMCRMCLIELEGVPKLQAACNTPVKEGMSVITKSPRVIEAREGTMEFLLANHPLDCPVCDKAGECHLQDNSFSDGKGNSRFTGEKRNHPQEDIGENLVINHNRCIICYRCVRFEKEKLGVSNLGLFERGSHSLIGLTPGAKPVTHNYQGALADLCPVGALLNKKTMFKSRVWWYKTTDTVCTGCSTVCPVESNVRDNKMYRLMPREIPAENQYFICDQGRFNLDWLNSNRLQSYYANGTPVISSEVYSAVGKKFSDSTNVAILGGARESNENLLKINEVMKSSGKKYFLESVVDEGQNHTTEQVDFLLTRDERPNTRGAKEAGFKSDTGLKGIIQDFNDNKIQLLFILNEGLPEGLTGSGTVVLLQTNLTEATQKAGYVVPIQTYAEQSGSFINKSGIARAFGKAMEPVQGLLTSGAFFEKLFEASIQKKEAAVGNY